MPLGAVRALMFTHEMPHTTIVSPLSLHDALPISRHGAARPAHVQVPAAQRKVRWLARVHYERRGRLQHAPQPPASLPRPIADRKSTRLNSSHVRNSYAVFCLKKKNNTTLH